MPTLPNGAGGYQLGDGNLTEVNLTTSPVATAYTAAATLTAADLGGGLVVYTSASAADLTLPTVAIVNATISSAKTNSAFDIALVATAAGVLARGCPWRGQSR
jgi:hypothetical protein